MKLKMMFYVFVMFVSTLSIFGQGKIDAFVFGGGAAETGFLIDHPGAIAAYSFRNLKSSVTNVVRIRRDNDDAESDFTALELTNGTMASWVGASNNGYVVTIYDQTGNGHDVTNTTTSQQMSIINAGTTYSVGSGLAFYMDNSTGIGLKAPELNGNTNIDAVNVSVFAVFNNLGTNASDRPWSFGNTSDTGSDNWAIGSDNSFRFDGALSSGSISAAAGEKIRSSFKNSSEVYNDFINTSSNISGSSQAGQTVIDDFYLSAANTFAGAADTYLSEVIIYFSDETSNRSSIESDLNAYYSIY